MLESKQCCLAKRMSRLMSWSRIIPLLLCFLLLVATGTGCEPKKIDLEIVQANFYDVEIPEVPRFTVIIGELENTSDVAVVPPIIVEVLDSSGEPVSPHDPSGGMLPEGELPVTPANILPPGAKVPFIFLVGPSTAESFQGYTFAAWGSVAPDVSENYHSELAVATHQSVFEGSGQESRFVIKGVVKNTGSAAAKEVRVIASCYDEQGTIVGMGFRADLWRTEESQQYLVEFLLAGEEADFEIKEMIIPDTTLMDSYTLQVEGLQASPEEVAAAKAEETYITSISQIIEDTLGESNRGVRRITATGISSGGRIRITFSLQDAEDYQAILEKAKTDILAVMKALYTSDLLVSEVTMRGTYPISNGGEEEVAIATLGAEAARQLNWVTMTPAGFWERLDDAWVHPTLLGQ